MPADSLQIRPFDESDDADYVALVAIRNAILPEYAVTVQEIKDEETRRDPKCLHGRWLAEEGGRAVAIGHYGQSSWAYHPRRFYLRVSVLPEREGRGIGGALYDHLLTALEPHSPISLHNSIREDWERGLRFAADRRLRRGDA